MKMQEKKKITQCETCAYYDYDEEMEAYICLVNFDEDEMASVYGGARRACPYYRFYDEYKMVQKQN